MKKLFTLLLLMLLPLMASAYPVEINGIYYNLKEGNVAEVTTNPNHYSGEVVIPEKVTYKDTEYSVTSIGRYAFEKCGDMTSVTIPNSVTIIDGGAFLDCSGLTTVTVPNSVTTIGNDSFRGCHGLASISIPNSVTSIGKETFYGCIALTVVTIPNSVTSIGDGAFSFCNNLTSVSIPNSVTSIGNYVFQCCYALSSLSIPNSVTSIGMYAFNDCSSLTSLSIPNSVTTIGNGAFFGCSGLTTLTIPNSVTTIGERAFFNCTGLTTVTIPSSVTTIGEYVFCNCRNLLDVYCYAELLRVESGEGQGLYTSPNAFSGCSLEDATLHVPAGCEETYDAVEPWKWFGKKVPMKTSTEDEVSIGDTGKTTYCSQYDLDFTNVEGLKAYIAIGYDDNDKIIWMARVMKVPHNTGLLLKGDIKKTYKIPHASVNAYYTDMFVGNLGETITIGETDDDKTNYYLSGKDGTFKSVNKSANIGKNKAYLQLPTSVFAGTRSVGTRFDDEEGTTGIEANSQELKANSQELKAKSQEYYTLQGQRVENPGKGLYIKNGRIIIIK